MLLQAAKEVCNTACCHITAIIDYTTAHSSPTFSMPAPYGVSLIIRNFLSPHTVILLFSYKEIALIIRQCTYICSNGFAENIKISLQMRL